MSKLKNFKSSNFREIIFLFSVVCAMFSCDRGGNSGGQDQGDSSSSGEKNQLAVVQSDCIQDEQPLMSLASASGGCSYDLTTRIKFRCEQAVIGDFKVDGNTVTVTFHPQDMNPASVAKCMCNYDLQTSLNLENAGTYTLKILSQQDNYGGVTPPVSVSESSIECK